MLVSLLLLACATGGPTADITGTADAPTVTWKGPGMEAVILAYGTPEEAIDIWTLSSVEDCGDAVSSPLNIGNVPYNAEESGPVDLPLVGGDYVVAFYRCIGGDSMSEDGRLLFTVNGDGTLTTIEE